MVLQCQCGGSVEIVSGSYERDEDGNITGEGMAHETYECVSCGRKGGFTFGNGREETSGCVTTSGAQYDY